MKIIFYYDTILLFSIRGKTIKKIVALCFLFSVIDNCHGMNTQHNQENVDITSSMEYLKADEKELYPDDQFRFDSSKSYLDFVASKNLDSIIVVGNTRADFKEGNTSIDKHAIFFVDIGSTAKGLPDLECDVKNMRSIMLREHGINDNSFDCIIFESLPLWASFSPNAINGSLKLLKPGGRLILNSYPRMIVARNYQAEDNLLDKKRLNLEDDNGKTPFYLIYDRMMGQISGLNLYVDTEDEERKFSSMTHDAQADFVRELYTKTLKNLFTTNTGTMVANVEFKKMLEVKNETGCFASINRNDLYGLIITKKLPSTEE
jgi:SAM-dependent methyltransferase